MKWNISMIVLVFLLACSEDTKELIPEDDFSLSATYIFFNGNEDEQQIKVSNFGSNPIGWSATVISGDFVQLRNSQGEIAPESSGLIVVEVDRQNLEERVYQSALEVSIGTKSFTLTVEVSGVPSMSFDVGLIDAAYSEKLNAVIAIDNANQLHLIDPKNQFIQTLDLEFPATCMALSPDGDKVLVGHNYAYSIVDLVNFEVAQVQGILIEVFDAIYATDEWIYLFPNEDQWVSIHGYNLVTGEELTSFNNIREKTIAKKHPTQDFMYGISTNSTPKDIEKYGYGNRPEILYETPYHGDYPIGADLWVNGQENYILTQAGSIFRVSDSPADDLTYLSSLSLGSSLIDAAQFNHSRNENYLLVSSNSFEETSEVLIYTDTWELVDRVGFPPVEYDDQLTSEFNGEHIFFNALGGEYYVLGSLPQNNSKSAILNYQLQ